MRILFSRHGQSNANVERIISNRNLPHGLTYAGATQSNALAGKLIDCCNITKIYASPIIRAVETASIVAEKLGLPVTISPELREFDCGKMEGRGDDEAWAIHNAIVQIWDEEQDYDQYIPPDGESYNDMKTRFVPFVKKLIEENEEHSNDILLVSHGGMLHQMLPLVIANVNRMFTKQYPLENCELVITFLHSDQLVCSNWAGKGMS